MVNVCGQRVRLPTISQLHRNIVWEKNWHNPIDLVSFLCSIPIYDKTPGVGEGTKCGEKQNSIPENGDFLPHLLPPCTPDPISSVCPPAEESYGFTIHLSHIPIFHPCAHLYRSGVVPKAVLVLVLSEEIVHCQVN